MQTLDLLDFELPAARFYPTASPPSAVITTNFGDITIELFPEKAPLSVGNFLHYAFDNYYDNVLFHRVVNNFVIQAGLFDTQGRKKITAQRGPISLESDNGLTHLRGTVGMARTDQPNTATSQFFINLVDNPGLNYSSAERPGYAVFGRITSGLEVVDAIAKVPVSTNNGFENVPNSPVIVRDVQISSGADQLIKLPEFKAAAGVTGARLEYSIAQISARKMSDGAWAVVDVAGFSIAKLIGYERIFLNDKAIGLDLAGNAGQAYRIYKAAFDRDPMAGDTVGLGYWIAQMDRGMSTVEVAARFIDSNEFRALYGANPTNGDFLTRLYQNVLDRSPDEDGYAWWIDQLQNNPEKSWKKVLADFAESRENQSNVISLIANGITYDLWVG